MIDILKKIRMTFKKRAGNLFSYAQNESEAKLIYFLILLFPLFCIYNGIAYLIENKNALDSAIVIITLFLAILNNLIFVFKDCDKYMIANVYPKINSYASLLFSIGGVLYFIFYIIANYPSSSQICFFKLLCNSKILFLNLYLFIFSLFLFFFDEANKNTLKIYHSFYWGLILVIYILAIV